MAEYNRNWTILRGTVEGMRHRTDLSPQQVTECLDTIIAAATAMAREGQELCPGEVHHYRRAQLESSRGASSRPHGQQPSGDGHDG